jgi:hypothetical protein
VCGECARRWCFAGGGDVAGSVSLAAYSSQTIATGRRSICRALGLLWAGRRHQIIGHSKRARRCRFRWISYLVVNNDTCTRPRLISHSQPCTTVMTSPVQMVQSPIRICSITDELPCAWDGSDTDSSSGQSIQGMMYTASTCFAAAGHAPSALPWAEHPSTTSYHLCTSPRAPPPVRAPIDCGNEIRNAISP